MENFYVLKYDNMKAELYRKHMDYAPIEKGKNVRIPILSSRSPESRS